MVEDLLDTPQLDSDEAIAYFYCSRTSNDTRQRNAKSILLSLLRQLAAPLPGLPLRSSVISVYNRETTRGGTEARLSLSEVAVLLDSLLQNHYKSVTIVIDALDECDNTRMALLETLTQLTYNPKRIVKTLVASRNDPDIDAHFSKVPNLTITATDNAPDIERFVEKEIGSRLLHGRARQDLVDRVGENLKQKSNGNFRWVALQVNALCSPDRVYSEQDINYLLARLPVTLEDTYKSILDDIDSYHPYSRDAINSALKLLACTELPLGCDALLEAISVLSVPPYERSPRKTWNETTLLRMLRGLVAVEHKGGTLIFTHLSVKEFLESHEAFGGENAHAVAAEACLKTYILPVFEMFDTCFYYFYARTCLCRHYLNSGPKRKDSELRKLMEDFLFTEGQQSPYHRWNRDHTSPDVEAFETHEYYLPGAKLAAEVISKEVLACHCLPAQPLFVICVYGLDEFLERSISGDDCPLDAENYWSERPLEVATRCGNFGTMKQLYMAGRSVFASPQWSTRWLEAAAKCTNLDVWNFVIKHAFDGSRLINPRKAITLAAKNPIHGLEMIEGLSSNINIPPDEVVIGEVFRGCASLETLETILTHSNTRDFTESMLQAAAQNDAINPEVTKLILSRNPEVMVSEACFAAVLTKSWGSHSDVKVSVVKTLLNHPKKRALSEEIICKMAMLSDDDDDDDECMDLILQHVPLRHISEDLLAAAASNPKMGHAKLRFLLNHAKEYRISQEVLQMAALNGDTAYGNLRMVLAQPDCPAILNESLYIMLEKRSENGLPSAALDACELPFITTELLDVSVANCSVEEMEYIFYRPRAFPITSRIYEAALTNSGRSSSAVDALAKLSLKCRIELSEPLLYSILSMGVRQWDVLVALENEFHSLPVSERCMVAAVDCSRCEANLFRLLLKYETILEPLLTDQVLTAAINGLNLEFVRYFEGKKPNFEVREEFFLAAIANPTINNAILKILLSQKSRCPITRPMLLAATERGVHSVLDLLLSQPEVSNLLKPRLGSIESDNYIIFDMKNEGILVPMRGDVTPGQLGTGLCTTELGQRLDDVGALPTDCSRLIEAAAAQKDGKFRVQYLLSRYPGSKVTHNALLAAVTNESALTSLLDLLLEHYDGEIGVNLFEKAASNKYRGTSLIEILLKKCPQNSPLDAIVTTAAMKNPYCALSLFGVFRRESGFLVTKKMVDAAVQNLTLGRVLLHTLLVHALHSNGSAAADYIFSKFSNIPNGLRDALFMSSCYGHCKALEYLIRQKVDVSIVSGELGTALNVAVYANEKDAVEILLAQRCDLESKSSVYGTPLRAACLRSNLDVVRSLAEHGVDINASNDMERTELSIAARKGNRDLLDLLLSLGASTTKLDAQGMVLMHHATLAVDPIPCLDRLIGNGCSIEPKDSAGWTPLHWASKAGNIATVARLLDAGANQSELDCSNMTPLDVAVFSGNLHLRGILFEPLRSDSRTTAGEKQPYAGCDACNIVSTLFSSYSCFRGRANAKPSDAGHLRPATPVHQV